MTTIEIYVGSVPKIKVGDMFIIKSHLYEVTSKAMDSTTVYLTGMDNEGLERRFEFSHDTFS
jgi:hypothetical protein